MIKLHVRRVLFFAVLGLVVSLVIAAISPRIYEARAEMLLGEQTRPGVTVVTEDVARILERGTPQTPATERQLLRSQAVFLEALARVAERRNLRLNRDDVFRLYMMYDVVGQDRRNQENEGALADIRVKAYNPNVAADLANEVMIEYNNVRMRGARESVGNAIQYLQAQIGIAREALRAREREYQTYKESAGLADIRLAFQERTQYAEQLRQTTDSLRNEIVSVSSELQNQEQQLRRMPQYIEGGSGSGRNPIIGQLESQITSAEAERAALLAIYEEDAIQVRQINDTLRQLRARLAAEKRRETFTEQNRGTTLNPNRLELIQAITANRSRLRSLESRLADSQRMLDNAGRELQELPAKEIRAQQLERELRIVEDQYQRLQTQVTDLQARQEQAGRAALILRNARAEDAEEPVSPNFVLFGLVGTLAGIALGLMVSFGIESLRLRVHTSSQLSELTGLPVAATVPILPKGRSARIISALAKATGRPAESFRYMAFALAAKETEVKRTVMFTGVGPLAGTSSSAAQFALSMAKSGTRTILVDANLRRKEITQGFGMADKTGLSDMLGRKLLPSDGSNLLQATAHENLFLLPAGQTAEVSLADMATTNLESVLESLRTSGDVIVFDTPPCDVVADASRLARYADEVCLVVSATSTVYRAIPMAQDILTRAGAKNISLVLTDASPQEEAFSNVRSLLRAE